MHWFLFFRLHTSTFQFLKKKFNKENKKKTIPLLPASFWLLPHCQAMVTQGLGNSLGSAIVCWLHNKHRWISGISDFQKSLIISSKWGTGRQKKGKKSRRYEKEVWEAPMQERLAKLKHRGYKNEQQSVPAFFETEFRWQKVICSPLENICVSLVLIKPSLLLLNLNYHVQHKMFWAQYWLPQEPREKIVLIFCTVVILSLICHLYSLLALSRSNKNWEKDNWKCSPDSF